MLLQYLRWKKKYNEIQLTKIKIYLKEGQKRSIREANEDRHQMKSSSQSFASSARFTLQALMKREPIKAGTQSGPQNKKYPIQEY